MNTFFRISEVRFTLAALSFSLLCLATLGGKEERGAGKREGRGRMSGRGQRGGGEGERRLLILLSGLWQSTRNASPCTTSSSGGR